MPAAPATPLQPLLIRAVVESLQAIFNDGRHADKVIEYSLRQNKKAGSRDRAFIAETVYEVVRNFRLYFEILGARPVTENDYWKICGIHFALHLPGDLPPFREFKGLDPAVIRRKNTELAGNRAVRESIPDWLDQLGAQELGSQWDATLDALNHTASVVIRANTLKTTVDSLQQELQTEHVDTNRIGDSQALVLQRRQNIFQTRAFREGWLEVQDFSSQQVAPLLAPEPGMRVIDACAGAGGKTLHLAALMQNKGSIIALDTHGWKLDALRMRARRAGAFNIEVRPIENNKTIKRLYGTADRLLLDVPCSGLGVLRRNPDTKWKLTPAQIEELHATQQTILQDYSPMLKPGGRMVYATCSILPSENRRQVDRFLESEAGAGYKLLADKSILPQDEGFDGFYMALLERTLK